MSGIFETFDEITKETEKTLNESTEHKVEENTETKPEEPKSEGIFGVIDEAEKEKAEETVKEQESSKEEPAVESIVDFNELKQNQEEISTERVHIQRKGNKVPALAKFETVMDETIETLAKHIAKYAKGLKGSDYYNYIRNMDIIDSNPVKWLSENVDFKEFEILDGVPLVLGECVWDPDHGVAVDLKTFKVGPQDEFI